MQTSDSESIDSVVPLFDVVISMPPGAKLETIQRLAETEAGLPPDRVERLLKVLRITPKAKVGAAVTLERAEEEKARYTKAGLDVEIAPLQADYCLPTNKVTQQAPVFAKLQIAQSAESTEKVSDLPVGNSRGGYFQGKAGLLVGVTVALAFGLFYAGNKGITVGGVSLPWGKKEVQRGAVGSSSMQQASVSAANPADEPDADDPLIQAIGGKRAGAKSFTLEEALAAAAMPAAMAADAVPKQTRQLLTAEFAVALAELGQGSRAREVLKTLTGDVNPRSDAQAASALLAAQGKLQAWSVLRMDSSQGRQTAEGLKTKTQAIANAQERALLQGQVADILSRSAQLPADVPRAFLSLAAESLKAITGAQSNVAIGNFSVSMAEIFLRETTVGARLGTWSKARASATQVEDLIKQAPDAWTLARLHAVDYHAKQQTGQTDEAVKSLESALTLAGKNSNLFERAIWLRSIAQLSDAGTQEQFETVAGNLQSQLNAKSGLERAQGLTELSLLYAAAGLPGKSSQLRSQAQATTGLSAAENAAVNTDLIVRGDIAMAKMLHAQGRYAEAETVLQRVVDYLF